MIDAAREGYFFNNDPNYKPEAATLQSFPELYAIVSRRLRAGRRGRALRGDLPSARQGRRVARRRNPVAKFAAGPGHKRGDGKMRRLVGAGIAKRDGGADCRACRSRWRNCGSSRPEAEQAIIWSGSIAGRPRRGSVSFRRAAPERESRAVARLPRLDGRRAARQRPDRQDRDRVARFRRQGSGDRGRQGLQEGMVKREDYRNAQSSPAIGELSAATSSPPPRQAPIGDGQKG